MTASKKLCEQTGAIVLGGITVVNLKYQMEKRWNSLTALEIDND